MGLDGVQLGKQAGKFLKVLLDETAIFGLVKSRSGMEHGHIDDVSHPLGCAMYPGYRHPRESEPHRKPAKGHDNLRLDESDLLSQIRSASGDLVRLRIAILRWATLDDIGDVYVAARQIDGAEK